MCVCWRAEQRHGVTADRWRAGPAKPGGAGVTPWLGLRRQKERAGNSTMWSSPTFHTPSTCLPGRHFHKEHEKPQQYLNGSQSCSSGGFGGAFSPLSTLHQLGWLQTRAGVTSWLCCFPPPTVTFMSASCCWGKANSCWLGSWASLCLRGVSAGLPAMLGLGEVFCQLRFQGSCPKRAPGQSCVAL